MSLLKRIEERNIGLKSTDAAINEKSYIDKNDPYRDLKDRIHKKIVDEMSLEENNPVGDGKTSRAALNAMVTQYCNAVMAEERIPIPHPVKEQIIADMIDDVLGYGPIEPLLKEESISEIMVNGPHQIYVERAGKLLLTDTKFKDDNHVMTVIERIVAPIGRRIDESSPLVDARLPDGSRVNAIIPPLSLVGALYYYPEICPRSAHC